MTRSRLARVGIAIILVLTVGLCATARPAGERTNLHARVAVAVERAGHGGQIHLAEVTDFEWDRVHIFGAYSTREQIEAKLDGWTPLSPAGHVLWGDLFLAYDGYQLLAFVDEGEVVAWTVLNQGDQSQTYVEFHPGQLPHTAAASEAQWTARRFGVGWTLIRS